MIDPHKLRPSELCRLLNSTPLGVVISDRQLREQRSQAGLHIGTSHHVDLVRYVAWLVRQRHAPSSKPAEAPSSPGINLAEAAAGGAADASRREQVRGHGQKLTRKQEAVIAALLTESTYAAAASQAGVSEATLYRWLHMAPFRAAYREARRSLLESAIGRVQAATGQAVETLVAIARHSRRDGDRLRAATVLLDHALRGLAEADRLHGPPDPLEGSPWGTSDVVRVLSERLRQIDQSELSTAEKSRLTASLADALLRALGVDVLDKRLEALQTVLDNRREVGEE